MWGSSRYTNNSSTVCYSNDTAGIGAVVIGIIIVVVSISAVVALLFNKNFFDSKLL